MKNLLLFLSILFITSCSPSPLDKEFNEITSNSDLKATQKVLAEDDYIILSDYIKWAYTNKNWQGHMRTPPPHYYKPKDFEGITYSQLLEEAKASNDSNIKKTQWSK